MDGGDNWAALTMPFTECIYQVRPITSTLVYAAGWGGYFFRSTDGRDNWTSISIDPNWQGWVFGMRFRDALNGVVAQTDGRIYRTIDGGSTWTPSTTATSNNLRGISMPDTATGWAVGFFGTAQKSTDGGATWNTINTGYPGDSYYGVHFTDADHGVICGGFYAGSWQGVIMRTTNGGSSWSRIHTGGPVLNGITINDGSIFAVGTEEVIIMDALNTNISTMDHGASWTVRPSVAHQQVVVEPSRPMSTYPWTLEVLDARGALVHATRTSDRSTTIDVSDWCNGIYSVRLLMNDAVLARRFVVAH